MTPNARVRKISIPECNYLEGIGFDREALLSQKYQVLITNFCEVVSLFTEARIDYLVPAYLVPAYQVTRSASVSQIPQLLNYSLNIDDIKHGRKLSSSMHHLYQLLTLEFFRIISVSCPGKNSMRSRYVSFRVSMTSAILSSQGDGFLPSFFVASLKESS